MLIEFLLRDGALDGVGQVGLAAQQLQVRDEGGLHDADAETDHTDQAGNVHDRRTQPRHGREILRELDDVLDVDPHHVGHDDRVHERHEVAEQIDPVGDLSGQEVINGLDLQMLPGEGAEADADERAPHEEDARRLVGPGQRMVERTQNDVHADDRRHESEANRKDPFLYVVVPRRFCFRFHLVRLHSAAAEAAGIVHCRRGGVWDAV